MLLALCAVFGAAIGTGLALLAERVPAFKPPLARPYCAECGHRLPVVYLIPFWGHLLHRGRCPQCLSGLPWRVPIVQVVAATLFVIFAYNYRPGVQLAFALVHLSFLVLIALIDLEHQLILNRVVYPAMAVALVGVFVLPQYAVTSSLLGGLAGFSLFFLLVFVYPAGMGMGDARLAAYIGLILGLPHLIIALILTSLLAGMTAIVLLATGVKTRKDAMPFGPFLVIGGVVMMLYGQRVLLWFGGA